MTNICEESWMSQMHKLLELDRPDLENQCIPRNLTEALLDSWDFKVSDGQTWTIKTFQFPGMP